MKNIMYIMVAVAVVLAAALAYIWYERTSLVNDLKVEKEDLTAQMIALQRCRMIMRHCHLITNQSIPSLIPQGRKYPS